MDMTFETLIARRQGPALELTLNRPESRNAMSLAMVAELQQALDEVRTLQGLLPMCAWCKKVRDDQGYWDDVASYIDRHTEASVSHGICPDCSKEHFPATKPAATSPDAQSPEASQQASPC